MESVQDAHGATGDRQRVAPPFGANVSIDTSLEDLVAQLRQNASNDVEFAQRVALACITLVETKADPAAAIRVTFRIQ